MPRKRNERAVPCNIKHNILKGKKTWNPYNKDFKEYHRNIGNTILEAFQSNPNFIGQVDAETGEQNTFQQMKERSVKCALAMKELKIRRNDVVMMCSHNQLDAYVPFLATLYIGAVINPLDEHLVKGNLIYFLEQSKPKILFMDEKYFTKTSRSVCETKSQKDLPQMIFFDADQNTISLKSIMNNNYDPLKIDNFHCAKTVNVNETAINLFTPGTTASPKNIEIPRSAFMASPDQHAPDMRPNDIALWFDSLGFINGIFMTIQAILMHVKVIRVKSNFRAEKLWELVEQHKVTWMFLETSMCNQLIKYNNITRYDVSSLRTIVFSGSSVGPCYIHMYLKKLLPKTTILQAYSLTETGIIAYQRQSGKYESNGYVSENVQLKIVSLNSDKEKPLGPINLGEICCKSPFMMIRKNHESIICDGQYNSNWFRTGDLGYYDTDGEIYIIGRINQIYNYKEHIIFATAIENLLLHHSAVSEAVVILVPCYPNNHAMAFVSKVPGKEVMKEELELLISEDLGSNYAISAGVIFLYQFPRIPNGKINRKLLHEWAQTYIYE